MDFRFQNKLLIETLIRKELKAEPLLSFIYTEQAIDKIIFLRYENGNYALLGFHFYGNNFVLYDLEYDTYIKFTENLFLFEAKINNSNVNLLLSYLKTIKNALDSNELTNEALFEGILINEFRLKLSHIADVVIRDKANSKVSIAVVDSCLKLDRFMTINDLSAKSESLYLLSSVEISEELNNISLLNRAVLNFNDTGLSFCCKQTFIEENNINFIYVDMADEELSNRVTGGASNIKKPHQLIELMVRTSDAKWRCFDFDDMDLHNFSIFVPIKNIKLESEINIGFTKFFNDCFDNDIKKFKESMKIPLDNYIFAMTTVDANTFYNAYGRAITNISIAFNILLSVLRSSYLYNISTDTKDNFNRDLLFPKPYLLDWIYIKNNSTSEFVILDINNMDTRTVMNINEDEISKLEKIDNLENIYLKQIDSADIIPKNKKHEKEINHLSNTFNSLNWINKSWDTSVPVDKIVYSIIALEFLVSGVTVTPKLKKSISSKIREDINSKIEYYVNNKETEFMGIDFEDTDKEQGECLIAFKDSINNLFNMAMDAPFSIKIEYLTKSLNVPLEDFELELLKRARKIRNDIVHGKGNEYLNEIEMKQLNNIITKIAHYKLISYDWGV